jgi:hypothetical protein
MAVEPAPSGRTTRRKKPKQAATPAPLTAYVVLKALQADASARVSLGLDVGLATAWLPVLNQTAEQGPDGHVRVVMAANRDKAIEAVTGPDGPDIVEGSYKAVALSSWRGGVTTRRTMKSDRLPLEEALSA